MHVNILLLDATGTLLDRWQPPPLGYSDSYFPVLRDVFEGQRLKEGVLLILKDTLSCINPNPNNELYLWVCEVH